MVNNANAIRIYESYMYFVFLADRIFYRSYVNWQHFRFRSCVIVFTISHKKSVSSIYEKYCNIGYGITVD